MEKIVRKTKRQLAKQYSYAGVYVRDTVYECWSCSNCGALFSGDDVILEVFVDGKKDHYACPNYRGGLFNRRCRNRIYGGERSYYEKYYDIKP